MTLPDTNPATKSLSASPAPPRQSANPIANLARIIGQAARFPGDAYGLGSGERAALARMDPDAMRAHQVAALSRALIQAELEPENWMPETWRRWALIAHGMALAGHNGKRTLGEQLFAALGDSKSAENRVTRLLTARGDAFRQLIPPLLRLLASREVAPNWHELGGLILSEGKPETESQERAEHIRMNIVGRYFSAQATKAKTDQH
ncbi:MAG: type I-E CRISPR-associated protein Cse2/CasB [Gammaproteobacteria bacterium]|nr:type I-E CRISPR-associated protein Cse2/CasB [Gammaproteobacteria bacterium]MCB1817226.1 type I-E CRISPR-associated protein Cse2/CasB [Gammaproteobacteria bacterium]MCW5586647.1 type I-E CRISPR-associated protein Cse2/CasB [Chromatiales bacterium]HOP16564.1 type I-E CRISPR-associated protein Cse2/CasB [Gammaproteobacteria bacterium]